MVPLEERSYLLQEEERVLSERGEVGLVPVQEGPIDRSYAIINYDAACIQDIL